MKWISQCACCRHSAAHKYAAQPTTRSPYNLHGPACKTLISRLQLEQSSDFKPAWIIRNNTLPGGSVRANVNN